MTDVAIVVSYNGDLQLIRPYDMAAAAEMLRPHVIRVEQLKIWPNAAVHKSAIYISNVASGEYLAPDIMI